tara:strand:+ start:4181 stop:4360 length:180 start_codon:yes stop_codon:yes gene_type:complete
MSELLTPGHFKGCSIMGKGDNQRGNREAKKPKKVKEKVLATANSNAGKPVMPSAAKKGK